MLHQATERATRAAETTGDRGPSVVRWGVNGPYARYGKRVLDILVVIAAAPIAAPLVGMLALIIRLSGGPALYGHHRVGKDGRLFKLWKLRSMVADADDRLEAHLAANPAARAEWDETQKLRDDPRVTAFGRFLRQSSLDELPQIWNILRGEMSVVGPRPFTPDQTHLYQGVAYYLMKPGLTGYWQVGRRNDASFSERAVDDARYAREMSLATDLRVMLKTVKVVLSGTGC